MNREKAFQALNGLDDRYIAEALRYRPGMEPALPERSISMKKKRLIALALAAALILALGGGAYALFSSMAFRTPEPEETFRIRWEDGLNGYVEWKDAKLAVTFPEKAESRRIQFRTGWLPEGMDSLGPDSWHDRLTAEQLAYMPGFEDMNQPLLIESYSMSMFNEGGALLLLYYTPGEIIEEHWDELDVDVLRFHATEHLDAVPQFNVPERTLEEDIILMANEEAGWIVRICGQIGMEQLVKVAENLEIRETGEVLRPEDFGSKFAFMDGGVG